MPRGSADEHPCHLGLPRGKYSIASRRIGTGEKGDVAGDRHAETHSGRAALGAHRFRSCRKHHGAGVTSIANQIVVEAVLIGDRAGRGGHTRVAVLIDELRPARAG